MSSPWEWFQVSINVNMGKDFSRNTVEISAVTDPGTLVAFAGAQHELYARGANTFLTEYDVSECDETVNCNKKNLVSIFGPAKTFRLILN